MSVSLIFLNNDGSLDLSALIICQPLGAFKDDIFYFSTHFISTCHVQTFETLLSGNKLLLMRMKYQLVVGSHEKLILAQQGIPSIKAISHAVYSQ